LVSILGLSGVVHADEGMWTFDNFPSATVKQRYGFAPSPPWLERMRLASIRLAQGCSGSFVSPEGLVMTNHHCAHACIEQLSTRERDFVATGFWAKTAAEEVKCPTLEVNQLIAITDVSARVTGATQGLSGGQFYEAQKGAMAQIEKECATGEDVRCDVVTLYHGGRYDLYKYRRFQDVRLAFAPEFAIAFFGGDPDNFSFPRYDLDVSFLRVYQDGKPARLGEYLPLSPKGPSAGELVFVAGNPGGTSRLTPLSQLEEARRSELPNRLFYLSELRGILEQFQTESAERRRISTALLFSVENSMKALKGRREALEDPAFWAQLARREQTLRRAVDADPELKKACGNAWDAYAQAVERFRPMRDRYRMLETGRGFLSELFRFARGLLRMADERPKANEKRLREYADSNLPALRQMLLSTAPLYPELEITSLTFSLTQLRRTLGADDPFVRRVLGARSPRELATALVTGSQLREVALRRSLLEGGKAAVDASADPMIAFARAIDPEAREVRQRFEKEVEGPQRQASEQVAKAQFKVYGTSTYPDATFSPRLSFGTVKGWREGDRDIAPFTTLAGAFERHTGRDPFALPASWLKAKPKLELSTPLDFVATNDIIGGNSGSPVIDRHGQAVGLVFDGNIHSLAGDYGFDERDNRMVAVDSAALYEALEKIYGAERIVRELERGAAAAKATSDHSPF
jgi:hypothetical protein